MDDFEQEQADKSAYETFAHQEFEDRSVIERLDDEATNVALEGEQDERDAQASEDNDYRIDFAWMQEGGQLQIASELTLEIDHYSRHVQRLYDNGLPADFLSAPVELNMLTGGLVVGGLQLLAVLTPSLRGVVGKLLDEMMEAMPLASAEDTALVTAITKKIVADAVATNSEVPHPNDGDGREESRPDVSDIAFDASSN